MNGALLSVEDLTMHYFTSQGEVKAVDGISFSLKRGQSMGLVGESGCGKSSIAISLLKLLPDNGRLISGRVMLDGVDLVQMSETQIQKVRWNRISIVFQAAMNSLNPVYKVGDQIIEAIETHMDLSRSQADQKVRDLFELVGLDSSFINRYPHEYSG